jgi:hypothetical protein
MHESPLIFTAESVRAILARRKIQTRRILNLSKLRIHVPRLVHGDSPFHATKAGVGYYLAGMNQHGAVWARLVDKDGETHLGLKPGEFDFALPWIVGKTHLGDYGDGRKEWTITPSEPCRIWIKEQHAWADKMCDGYELDDPCAVAYRADKTARYPHSNCYLDTYAWNWDMLKWRSPLFMPRWASRINLRVVSVRLQHLNDITDEDAVAEGVTEDDVKAIGALWARDAYKVLWDRINRKRAPWASNVWVARIEFTPEEVEHRV